MITLKNPDIYQEQIRLFTKKSIQAVQLYTFDPFQAFTPQANTPQNVLAVDIGGNKIQSGVYSFKNRKIQKSGKERKLYSSRGVNYLGFLEKTAEFARKHHMPVAISTAGTIEDNKLLRASNIDLFAENLHDKYDGNFGNVFPDGLLRFAANDTVTGLIAGSREAVSRNKFRNILFLINGSGLGCSVLKGNSIWYGIPQHIRLIKALNPYGQTELCHLPGHHFVCLERAASGRGGIENIYFQKTGRMLEGNELSKLAQEGEKLAAGLYDYSAGIVAHVLVGMVNVFDLSNLTVIFHGGCFQVPGYMDQVIRLTQTVHNGISFIRTYDFSENACLDGAALAAFYTPEANKVIN